MFFVMEGSTISDSPVLILRRTSDRFGEFKLIRRSSYPVYFSKACSCGLNCIVMTVYSTSYDCVDQSIYYNDAGSVVRSRKMNMSGVIKINHSCLCEGVYCDILIIDSHILPCLGYFDFHLGIFHRISSDKWGACRCYLSRLIIRGGSIAMDWASVIETSCPGGKVRTLQNSGNFC